MTERYNHTQVGHVILFSLGIAIIVIIAISAAQVPMDGMERVIVLSVLAVLGICMVLFYSLTVTISEDALQIQFGPGLIRKTFPLREIQSCHIVKNPWYYGWGIQLTPHGWLYNVSGAYAVEIQMTTGKKYRIGTDEPDELEKRIRESIERQQKAEL